MEENIRLLRQQEQSLTAQLKSVTSAIERAERNCQHKWPEAVYDPIRSEGFTMPGDKPGTMGIDWRGPTHVPSSTVDRWRRVCTNCGKIEYTKRSEKVVGPNRPVF